MSLISIITQPVLTSSSSSDSESESSSESDAEFTPVPSSELSILSALLLWRADVDDAVLDGEEGSNPGGKGGPISSSEESSSVFESPVLVTGLKPGGIGGPIRSPESSFCVLSFGLDLSLVFVFVWALSPLDEDSWSLSDSALPDFETADATPAEPFLRFISEIFSSILSTSVISMSASPAKEHKSPEVKCNCKKRRWGVERQTEMETETQWETQRDDTLIKAKTPHALSDYFSDQTVICHLCMWLWVFYYTLQEYAY